VSEPASPDAEHPVGPRAEPAVDGVEAPRPAPEPSWRNPANALTLLRVVLVPVIAVLLVIGGDAARWWAFGIFVFAALTDSIDGWVARRMMGVTRWGQLADPAADKALIVGSLAILAYLERLPWWAVGVIVVREIAVTAWRTVLVRRGFVMPASVFGKVKTVSQVVAVTLYLLPGAPPLLREVVLWVAVVATVVSGVEYAFRGRRIERAG
jgi:CDP-diacylglycerol--glycerol-3-phosphate 3-phosphatidyltransferase